MLSNIFRWLKSYFCAVHDLFILKKKNKLCHFFPNFDVFVCSQNQRLMEVGRDPWKSCCPSPLLQLSHLGLAGQNGVQMALDLQGRTLCPWATCCSSVSLTVKVCSCVHMEPPVFQCVPPPLVLSLPIPDKSLAPSSLLSPSDDNVLIRVFLSFLLAKQSLLPHPFLVKRCCSPQIPLWLSAGLPAVSVSHSGHCSCVSKGKGHLCPLLVQPMLSAWSGAHCWLLSNSRTPGPSLWRGFSSWRTPAWISVWDCSFTAHFSRLQSSLWMAAGPTGESATHTSVSPAALLRALPIINQDLWGVSEASLRSAALPPAPGSHCTAEGCSSPTSPCWIHADYYHWIMNLAAHFLELFSMCLGLT